MFYLINIKLLSSELWPSFCGVYAQLYDGRGFNKRNALWTRGGVCRPARTNHDCLISGHARDRELFRPRRSNNSQFYKVQLHVSVAVYDLNMQFEFNQYF